MKIGVDVRELVKGRQTGMGRILLAWLEEWPAFGLNHDVVAFGNQQTDFDLPCWRHPMYRTIRRREWMTLWWDHWTLKRLVERERPDLFFSPYYKAPLFLRCPFVVSLDDVIGLAYPPYFGWRTAASRALMKYCAERSWKVVTRSAWSRRDIVAHLGIPETKVVIIPNVVSHEFLPRPHHQAVRHVADRWGVKESYILYVGTLWPHKNVPRLIQAYAGLSAEVKSRYRLVIRGSGKQASAIRGDIDRLGLSARVEILESSISLDELVDLYSAASVFVFPSLYEGFGLPPLEAMACGVPVVASNHTSLPEVLGDAPSYVDPEDHMAITKAIEIILGDAGMREAMRLKGFQQAARYSASKSMIGFLETLESFRLERLTGTTA